VNFGSKPVIILGHGCRAAGVDPRPFLNLGIPVLSSWQGADLVDNEHPMYFGRPGIYGQRCANKILYEAEKIIAVGNRMCAWQIGHAGLRPEQILVMVDIDQKEAASHSRAIWIDTPIEQFMRQLAPVECPDWIAQCNAWRDQYPWIEEAHNDTNGFMNSYRFVERLQPMLRENEVIVTDNGSVMCPVFQALKLKPPQRLLTAGALGEMGCGLPGAIGASFARDRGEVLAFIGDGGFMMNVQELATIRRHWLPIKIMVFENDGYSMIKGTYDNMKKPRKGVSRITGLGLPSAFKVAQGFDIPRGEISKWDEFDGAIRTMLDAKGPFLLEVHIDPEQQFVPRLKPIIKDGKITPARFDQLSPIIESKTLVEADLA